LADGGVQIEWHTDSADLEIEIAANGVLGVYSPGNGPDEEWDADFVPAIERLGNIIAGLT